MNPPETAQVAPRRPLALTIVGWLFVLGGVLAIWDVVAGLMQNTISLNFGVLTLPVGIGLLRLKASSRRWAIFWVFLGYLALGLIVLGVLAGLEHSVTWLGEEIRGPARDVVGAGLTAVTFAVLAWTHFVLTRPQVVELFERAPAD